MNEERKSQRESLIMKRRGLNFISDQVAESMNDESIQTLENEVDNVAPKIIGLLSLSKSCDISAIRLSMVAYCEKF